MRPPRIPPLGQEVIARVVALTFTDWPGYRTDVARGLTGALGRS